MTTQTPPNIPPNPSHNNPADNPYQAPKSEVYQDFHHGGAELAGRGGRLLAVLIDAFISIVVALPIWFLTGMFTILMEGEQLSLAVQAGMFVYGMVMYLVVHGYLLNKYGQTVGKRLMGIYIANVNTNEKAELKDIFLKRVLPVSIVSAIPFIGGLIALVDALMIFRSDKRCAHDLIAGTHVLNVNSSR